MSTSEAKRAKRRKNKYSSGKSNSGSTPSEPQMQQNDVSTEENGDAAERIARLMDASDESDLLMPPFIRGPNPYLDQEKCLLCGVDRNDPTHSENEKSGPDGSDARSDLEGHTFSQLPLWVCPPCRRAADSDLNRKIDLKSVAEIPMPPLSLNTGHMGFSHSSLSEATLSSVRDITLDAPSLSLFSDLTLATANEPVLPNGSLCSCESCNERRHIAAEHDRETHELQKCWADLRGMVRALYSQEKQTLSQEESATLCELVARLCSRDPHQLFLRLESQVREFVIEKKVNLLKRLSHGYNTPPEAREVMSTLLTEYSQLCGVSRLVSEHLTDLKVHLERFKVTWELHNKHLYHSIVYADPAIHGSLDAVCEQLRNGALSKESYMEDTYPKLMHSFIDFRNEMSVILVIWHECQQLIEHYNKEQTALKVKQKWLKEDWEFFKAQRKILEQQVLKSNPKALTHSMEAQFTETMRNMLTGTKPTAEECHCPRCNRKRCPCDECTITHMITCGIINPEALETNGTHHTFNFPHDSNRYVIDVTPPSMSSTTSSSTSSSPVPISPAKMVAHLNACTDSLRNNEAPEEYSNLPDDNTDDVEEGEEENDDEEDDGDDEEEDDDEEEEEDGDEDHDREEEEEEEEEDDDLWQDQKEFDQMLASGKLGMPATPAPAHSQELLKSWEREQPEEPLELSAQDYALTPCACHHCVLQTPPEPPAGTEETSCQCHVCLQQQGQTVSTALPTSLPLPPRPAQLHLYPHIHGTLPPTTLTHQHVHVPHTHTAHITHAAHITHTAHAAARSLLQPQLYDLHGSLRSARLPLKLDFEDPEGIQNHLYHAYGDWDNTFDPRMLVPGAHRYPTGLGSDLVPSPLTSDMPFSMESLSSGSHGMVMSNVSTSLASSSAFKAVAAGFATSFQTAYHLPPEPASVEEVSSANSHQASNSPDMYTKTTSLTSSFPDTCTKAVSLTSSLPVSFASAPPSSVSVPHNPPFTRPVTLGGNVGTQPAGKEQRTYAQPCKKHTLVPISSVHSTSGKVGVPPLLSSSLHGNVNVPVFSNGIQGQNNKVPGVSAKVPRSGMVSNPNSHTCNHSQHVMHTNSNMEGYADPHSGGVGTCTNAAVLPTTINNVSVGTSTLCADPDCQQHHDDNCDSIDDSCSEKSSSTSTSNNQKEGKYCDCCYCEFFGHGNPPVAQTSKNYAEMRERLRRRLKRRNEAKQEGGNKENQSGSHADLLEIKGLEELLRFINGTDSDGGHSSRDKLTDASSHQNTSSKAAKRARQKQRKAEEKARQELRQQHKQKALKEKVMSERVSNVKKESRSSGTTLKKKGKHKEDKTGKLSETPDTLNINSSAIASACVNKAENSSLGTKAKPHLKETTTSESKVDNSATLNSNVSSSGNSAKTAVNQSSKPSQQQVVTSSGKPLTCLPPKANISHGPGVVTLPFEPALDLDSIKTSQPHCADNSKVVPSNSSPSTFGTNIQTSLQGLPESPNAKKAKRRLDAQQMQDARRRLEAQQQVQQQLLEMEEQARQQQLLRQQQQQQQKLLQQQQQLQAHKQQQSLLPRQQQEIETKQLLLLSANPQQSNKTNSNGVQASNSVNSSSSEAKIQNGMSSSCKLAHSPAPTVADNPSSKDSPSPRPKLIQPGSNGTMATQMSLSPENRVRLAKIAEKRTETQEHEQVKNVKSKKNKKKNKAGEVSKGVDEVFMPRSESDLENGEIDDFERELEEFKRFCFDAPNAPKAKPKIQVNVNLKDLYLKKKTGLSCS